jgi:uncharacterized phage-associated protein
MDRPYTPLAFANEFIAKSGPAGVVHMKLQKLVYLCYGWWLAEHDSSIIDEAPEVWQHGPVFASLYDVLKGFGHARVSTLQKRFFSDAPDRIDDDDEEALSLVDWVWQRYGRYDQFYLSDLTHQPRSPWHVTAEAFNFRVPRHTEIPLETIRDHFRSIAAARGFHAREQA